MLTTKALVGVTDEKLYKHPSHIHWPSVFIMKMLRVSEWEFPFPEINVMTMNEYLNWGCDKLKSHYQETNNEYGKKHLKIHKQEYDKEYDPKYENEHSMEIILWDYYMFLKFELALHFDKIIENSDVIYTLWMNEEFKGCNVYNQILALPNYED